MATERPQPSANDPEIAGLGHADASNQSQYPDPSVYARDVLSAYNGLRVFEGDFDRAQGQLRTIASAWLLSGIGAIGYLVIQQASYNSGSATTGLMPAVAETLRQLTFFLVSLGICAIWRIDQKVYQKLLHSVFALGYWIEF